MAEGDANQKKMRATVASRRPILGLIVETENLIASDAVFGYPGVEYPDDAEVSRHLESPANAEASNTSDVLVLSQDRLTLHITVSAAFAIDQFRILVTSASIGER